MILDWPRGETLLGKTSRDFSRLGDLITALEAHPFSDDILYAPRVWTCDESICQTEFYREQMLGVFDAQVTMLQDATPDTMVPIFSLSRAAGNPGQWNYVQPFQRKGAKGEFKPLVQDATPHHRMVSEFLRVRGTSLGETVLDQFHPPVNHGGGWLEFKNRAYDAPVRCAVPQ